MVAHRARARRRDRSSAEATRASGCWALPCTIGGCLTAPGGSLRFAVPDPGRAAGRHDVSADLTLGERRFGQVAEALVDVAG